VVPWFLGSYLHLDPIYKGEFSLDFLDRKAYIYLPLGLPGDEGGGGGGGVSLLTLADNSHPVVHAVSAPRGCD
jgi:hypothetical protein